MVYVKPCLNNGIENVGSLAEGQITEALLDIKNCNPTPTFLYERARGNWRITILAPLQGGERDTPQHHASIVACLVALPQHELVCQARFAIIQRFYHPRLTPSACSFILGTLLVQTPYRPNPSLQWMLLSRLQKKFYTSAEEGCFGCTSPLYGHAGQQPPLDPMGFVRDRRILLVGSRGRPRSILITGPMHPCTDQIADSHLWADC
jgi:hypothetical protein